MRRRTCARRGHTAARFLALHRAPARRHARSLERPLARFLRPPCLKTSARVRTRATEPRPTGARTRTQTRAPKYANTKTLSRLPMPVVAHGSAHHTRRRARTTVRARTYDVRVLELPRQRLVEDAVGSAEPQVPVRVSSSVIHDIRWIEIGVGNANRSSIRSASSFAIPARTRTACCVSLDASDC